MRFSSRPYVFALALSCLVQPVALRAADLDKASNEALEKTMKLLTDPSIRQAEGLARNPQGQFVDQQVKSLGGSVENSEAIYGLASEIFSGMVVDAGGDAAKMMEILKEAKENPAKFAERLSPEQRARLSELARRAPAGAVSGAPSGAKRP